MAGKATSLFDISAGIANVIDVFSGAASRAEGINDNDVQQIAGIYFLGGMATGTYFTARKAVEKAPSLKTEDVAALGGFFPRF